MLFCEAEERYGFENNQLPIAYVKILPNAENSFLFRQAVVFIVFPDFCLEGYGSCKK